MDIITKGSRKTRVQIDLDEEFTKTLDNLVRDSKLETRASTIRQMIIYFKRDREMTKEGYRRFYENDNGQRIEVESPFDYSLNKTNQ